MKKSERERQSEKKFASFPRSAVCPYFSSMAGNYLFGDGKPQPGSLDIALLIAPSSVALKYVREIRLSYSSSVILDRYQKQAFIRFFSR
ncbi:MAG: hypothetical protein LRY51_05675 [Geovibrio sp.]|nr:hypothetical protein [Geovibrio sp.]